MVEVNQFMSGNDYEGWIATRIERLYRDNLSLGIMQISVGKTKDVIPISKLLMDYFVETKSQAIPLVSFTAQKSEKSFNTFQRNTTVLSSLIYPEDLPGKNLEEQITKLGQSLIQKLNTHTYDLGISGVYLTLSSTAKNSISKIMKKTSYTFEGINLELADNLIYSLDKYSELALELQCFLPFEFKLEFDLDCPELDLLDDTRPHCKTYVIGF